MNNLYIILFLLIIILILIICSIIRFSYQNKGIISGGVAGLGASNRRQLVRSRSNSDDSLVTANYHPPQLPDSIIQYMEKNDRDTNKLDMQIKQLKRQIENKAYNDGEPNEFLKTNTEELKDLCNNDDFDYYYITYGKEKDQTIDKKTLKRLLKEHKNIPNGFPVMKKKIKKGGGKTFEDFKKFLAEDIAKSRDSTTNKYEYESILHYTNEIEKWFKQKERTWVGWATFESAYTKNKYFDKIVRLLSQVLFDKMQFISQNRETRSPTEIIESMDGILENYFNWLNKKDDDPELSDLQEKLGELNPLLSSSNEAKFDQFKKDLLFIINSGIKELTPISSIKCKSEIINGIIAWFTREKDALERIDAYIITVFVDKLMQLIQYKDFTTTNILEVYSRIQSLIIDPIEVEIRAYFDWLIKEDDPELLYIQEVLDNNVKYPTEELKFAEIVEIIELKKINEIRSAISEKQDIREKNIRRMFTAIDELDLGYR